MIMRCLIFYILVLYCVIACSHDDDKLDTRKGIGTVEITDSAAIIHFYDYSFIFDKSDFHSLSNDSRVCFTCIATQKIDNDSLIYKSKLVSISNDITTPLIFCNSSSEYITKGKSLCTPTDMHITRDYMHSDFFNITCLYSTRDNNNDYTRLVINSNEQLVDNDTIIIWLRHYQNRLDSLTTFAYDTISVPLNVLIKSDAERAYLRIKRFGNNSDTIITDYTYSWK